MSLKISKLEKKLKIDIKNKSLYIQAFTHKSSNTLLNYEKFEFLGDRILGLIISKKIFFLYPKEAEGILDKKFAKLVNKKTCAKIAANLSLYSYVVFKNAQKKPLYGKEKILGDVCEALICAIYLDKGYDYTERFVLRLWSDEIKKSKTTFVDPKTQLQEYSLKLFKKLPFYKTEYWKGPSHRPLFKISVTINGSKKFVGSATSKKEAEQNAARGLLKFLRII